MGDLRPFLEELATGRPLGATQVAKAARLLLLGAQPSAQVAAFLLGLNATGSVTPEVLLALATAMKEAAADCEVRGCVGGRLPEGGHGWIYRGALNHASLSRR
jgi:anthranilate phosphoribosyltransferase